MSPQSDGDVSARGLGISVTHGSSSLESDSGTGSRCSFLRAQVQRDPWLQQQSSATLMIRNCCCYASETPRKAHPEYHCHVYKHPCYVPSHHNRNGRGQSETFAESGNGCTGRLDVPKERLKEFPKLEPNTYLLIDVLEWSVGMLTVAHTMASNAGIASVLFAFDQHLECRI